MPDVGKYDKQERRKRETHETMRRIKIAAQIPGMEQVRWEYGIWLFCPRSGFRKVTDIAWFSKHMRRDETVEKFTSRLWCEECKRGGCVMIIPAPAPVSYLNLDRRRADVRALFVRDD